MGSRVIILIFLMAVTLEVYHRSDFAFGFLVLVASVSPYLLESRHASGEICILHRG